MTRNLIRDFADIMPIIVLSKLLPKNNFARILIESAYQELDKMYLIDVSERVY